MVQRSEVIEFYEDYFDEKIVPILNPHTGMDICTIILNEINDNKTINETTKNRYIALYNSGEIGAFLANIFLYALSIHNKASASLIDLIMHRF